MALLSAASPRPRRNAAGLIAALLILIPWPTPGWSVEIPQTSIEYAVKASYLYKFAPFIEWPPQAFPSASSPLNICVAGEDPFGPILDDLTRNQQLDTHPIVIKRMSKVEDGLDCQILFIGHSTTQSPAEMLRVVSHQPVLTVMDQGHGAEGGIIQFVLRDGRVRFDIDAAAAATSGVTISSKLLDLALSQRRR